MTWDLGDKPTLSPLRAALRAAAAVLGALLVALIGFAGPAVVWMLWLGWLLTRWLWGA